MAICHSPFETNRLVCECPSHDSDRRAREQITAYQPAPMARHVSESILDYPVSVSVPEKQFSLAKSKILKNNESLF